MQKTIITILFIATLNGSFAQLSPSTTNHKTASSDLLFLKSKKLNTAGWSFLGTGSVLLVVGYAIFPKHYHAFGSDKSKDNIALASILVMVLGGAALITSIPMFASSAAKKHKATLSIRNENVSQNIPAKANRIMTELSLNVSLGKSY